MTDKEIIKLFFQRKESALKEADDKYGKCCLTAAQRIICCREDAEECVNDAFYKAWQHIPPDKPSDLRAYLVKITRNVAVDRVRASSAEKRGSGEIPLIYDELDICASDMRSAEDEYISGELTEIINGLLKKLPKRERDMFVARYSLAYPVSEIAAAFGCSENSVRAILSKAREKLGNLIKKEGVL